MEGRSDAVGRFELRDLPAGEYDLSATLEGFDSAHGAIHLAPGETVIVSLTMVVASLGETVVSSAKVGESAIQSTPMAVSAVSNADVTRLALRTIGQIAALVPQ